MAAGRDGLAETLLGIAFLGEAGAVGALVQAGGGQQFVNRLVRSLPSLGTDPRMLAALRDQLPFLAEAAPVPFVEALESLLQGDSARLKPLFADRGFFGPSFQSGLLWALEGLAWSADYLPRVTMMLGRLDEVDPGGNVGNRPRNSLRDIFLAWHPGTSAALEDRVTAIQLLHAKHPQTAWWLLLKLLPQTHDSAVPTHEPTWRDFGRSEMPVLTNQLVSDSYRKYAELAFVFAETHLQRQIDLLDAYPQFPSEYRERIVKMLIASSTDDLSDELRYQAWKALHDMVSHHRAFGDADWAMKESDLKQLEDLASRYVPTDPVRQHGWILDNQWPETGFKSDDFDGKQRDIDQRRRNAMENILDQLGWEGVHAAIRKYQHPYITAIVLAGMVDDRPLLSALDTWAMDGSANCLSAIQAASGAKLRLSGEAWTELLITHLMSSDWAVDAKANALMNYPAAVETFRLVATLGVDVEKYYWEHCWLHAGDGDAATKQLIAESYMHHGRAVDLLSTLDKGLNELGVEFVLRILEQTIKSLNEGRSPIDSMLGYHLKRAFKWLRMQPGASELDVARLEYPFLPLLTGAARGQEEELVLHKLLAHDPDFFVQVLCDLYKPANGAPEHADEHRKSKGLAAWRLLESWRLVPGLTAERSIDKDVLFAWVNKARALAREKKRTDIADQHIGKVLYHAPSDPSDESWPPLAVLELIENSDSQHLGRGFALECINSRGVTSRAPLDGGELERREEDKWRRLAKALSTRWPRVRALFESIADDWSGQAEWHDQDAEKMRMRWS